jgi:hypothetical protein
MAGLLAARVLADFYGIVTVVERDELHNTPIHRRGVPQGRQPHLLLARSWQILEELFPGFLDELVARPAPPRHPDPDRIPRPNRSGMPRFANLSRRRELIQR